jgi:hypothetical protein
VLHGVPEQVAERLAEPRHVPAPGERPASPVPTPRSTATWHPGAPPPPRLPRRAEGTQVRPAARTTGIPPPSRLRVKSSSSPTIATDRPRAPRDLHQSGARRLAACRPRGGTRPTSGWRRAGCAGRGRGWRGTSPWPPPRPPRTARATRRAPGRPPRGSASGPRRPRAGACGPARRSRGAPRSPGGRGTRPSSARP